LWIVDEKCLDGAVEGFQKNAGIPYVYRVYFESLMQYKISVNRHKNRSIQVEYKKEKIV